MDGELKQTLNAISDRLTVIETRLTENEERLTERIHDTETRLLSAFHGWARPVEMRIKNLPALDERIVLLEERVGALERKSGGNDYDTLIKSVGSSLQPCVPLWFTHLLLTESELP